MIVSHDSAGWLRRRDMPLARRSGSVPAEVLAQVQQVTGADPALIACAVPPGLLDEIATAIAQMPLWLQQLMGEECLGVYCVRGLGSSAASDVVVQPDGRLLGVVVVLDVGLMVDGSANDWASWRAATPFRADPDWSLRMTIAAPQDDHRCAALQYILLHEFGHVLAARRSLLPPWWIAPAALRPDAVYEFLALSWQRSAAGQLLPLAREDFPRRAELVYYGAAPLPGAAMLEVYQQLQHTSFVTPYAAQNPHDDFAETFASYVHTVLLNKPHSVQIFLHGQPQLPATSYWDSARSMRKRHCLQRLLMA